MAGVSRWTLSPETPRALHPRWRPNPEPERYMDLYNNQVGRGLPSPKSNNAGPRIEVDDALKKRLPSRKAIRPVGQQEKRHEVQS